ncbi:hypothetical protein B0H10DRAFT_2000371 [Mycena sp. CBHHK59/15]|nr:hypothetical protein B0H10DRAFT_2000371 [Mycena sp. CBHHK59/15]
MALDENSTQPLTVSIVGAGMAGLTAAISLRRNGHIVEIFETSEIKTEVGAALGVQSNALHVLEYLGVKKENLKGVSYDGNVLFNSKSGEATTKPWLVNQSGRGLLCHRNDVYEELKRQATGEGEGPPAKLRLGNKVIGCDTENGASAIRTNVIGYTQEAPASNWSCFRAVFDASKLQGTPEFAWLTDGISGARSITEKEEGPLRMLFFYPCRSGSLINFVGLYPDYHQDDPGQYWSSAGTREELIEHFKDFHPKFLRVLDVMENPLLKWQLRALPLLPTCCTCHLPFLGQGAAIAIEEAGALGCLFPAGTRREDIPARLEVYQVLRKERGERINKESVAQAADPSKRGTYLNCESQLTFTYSFLYHSTAQELQSFIFEYDAIRAAQQCYQEHFGRD